MILYYMIKSKGFREKCNCHLLIVSGIERECGPSGQPKRLNQVWAAFTTFWKKPHAFVPGSGENCLFSCSFSINRSLFFFVFTVLAKFNFSGVVSTPKIHIFLVKRVTWPSSKIFCQLLQFVGRQIELILQIILCNQRNSDPIYCYLKIKNENRFI